MLSIDLIAISQQEAGHCLFRKGFNDLLCGPEGSRVCRHIEVDHCLLSCSNTTKPYKTLKVAVGTVKKSIAAI